MKEFLELVAILAAYIVILTWVLPALGVPT